MRLVELLVWSDINKFARKENRDNNMATEGHRHAGRKIKAEKCTGMDRELAKIMEKIYELKLKLQQDKKMVQVCEPKIGRSISEMGSFEDLKNCQEGKEEIPDCQEGNEMRSLWDLRDCHEDSQGISHC